jgi:hypothetical protein
MDGHRRGADWFEPPHAPAAYIPTRDRGGDGTANVSHYLTVQNVTQADTQARDAIEHFQRTLRMKMSSHILEIKAKRREASQEAAEVPVWLNTKRDVLCLQAPSLVSRRAVGFPENPILFWFTSRQEFEWSPHDFFRPLPFFGLDRIERVAIDWQCETARASIRHNCMSEVCDLFRSVHNVEVYMIKGERRKYCSTCLQNYLSGLNLPEGGDVEELPARLGEEFPAHHQEWKQNGPEEPGTFICQGCRVNTPCGEGRLEKDKVGTAPGWQPVCHRWHLPRTHSDIDTLLMGRLPSLKTFYIIDSMVKLRPGRTFTMPCEQFEGHNCKFVEVNTRDDAWDLNPRDWPRYNKKTHPNPSHSFRFADKLQRIAWSFACRQHAKARMDEQEANKETYDEDDDVVVMDIDHSDRAGLPLEKQPLDEPIRSINLEPFERLEYPRMGWNPALQPEWPDSVLPVKVKVMARIDN